MSIQWSNNLDLDGLLERTVAAIIPAAHAGAEIVLEDSQAKVPKESDRLAGTGKVDDERGGDNTVGISYDGPYARYQHESLEFRHPTGGQAKFLESAMVEKSGDALAKAADVIGKAL
jgi:hypothetical protein